MKSEEKDIFYTEGEPAEHLQAIGRFVTACSKLDVQIHWALKRITRIDDNVARALLGGQSIKNLFDPLKLIADVLDVPDSYHEEIELICREVGYILQVRSVVAHKPFSWTIDGKFEFHDTFTAKDASSMLIYDCTVEQLRNCAAFAEVIGYRVASLGDLGLTSWPSKALEEAIAGASRAKLDLPPNPGTRKRRFKKL